ncbi:hypothetical protein NEIMUCOT_06161 [Neisseria mucosa ATCC 25996]|uniref:Uncharacterized protein n=1 Tax=Neisseria mucosa (strain ATCC 25996 / DSM 4631 / NCTC 10774 / M26) TaxID=546266 RepID=D2ZZS8_NEIM2|nr:hypothetical protein NEIMUCOT_06161 [Neisseria mucosa ATCC 25996]
MSAPNKSVYKHQRSSEKFQTTFLYPNRLCYNGIYFTYQTCP